MDTEASRSEPGIPAPEELEARSDEEIDSILGNAARSMQAAAVAGLERLATGDNPRVARAAARALSEVRDESAADALVRIQDLADSKAVRKEAGRSLHRLRSAGVHPAAGPEPATKRVPVIPVPAGKVERAFAGYYDWVGTRVLATHVWAPARGRAFIVWVLGEDFGIDDCRVFHGSKRELEEFMRDAVEEMRLVEIDTEHARFLLKEAAEARRAAAGEMPREYLLYSEAVKRMPPAPTRPIIYEKMDADEIRGDATALRDSSRLLSLLFACPWGLDDEETKPYREKAIAVAKSVIYTSKTVRNERLRAIVDEAIAALFTQEVAQKYRRRLEETAYLLLLDGREKPARSAFAAALAIADGKPLREIPFVEVLVERSIGVVREGTPEARRLRRLRAEIERHRMVRPLFGTATAEGIVDQALREDEEDEGWEQGWDEDWDEDWQEEWDEDWEEEEQTDTAEEEDDEEDQPLIIDPRDPRRLR